MKCVLFLREEETSKSDERLVNTIQLLAKRFEQREQVFSMILDNLRATDIFR